MPTRNQWGSKHHNWKGGRKLLEGYVAIYKPEHPYAMAKGYVFEHRLVVEQSLGHYLPPGAVVHHVNETKVDNRPGNLVALQNLSEHMTLHYRLRILRAGGNPWTQHICSDCGPRDREHFGPRANGKPTSRCRDCRRRHDNELYRAVLGDQRRLKRLAARTANQAAAVTPS